MRISFDLDDTLFVRDDKIKIEKELKFPHKYFFTEKLRYGTIDIMNRIIENNIELWIYTTSLRTPNYIRKYFSKYGIKIKTKNIVNWDRHMKEVKGNSNETLSSKYPPKYKIDLHVDDEIFVKQNGDNYGFKVYLLVGNNNNWVEELWEIILKLKNNMEYANTFIVQEEHERAAIGLDIVQNQGKRDGAKA
jgi:hypothetical protein